MSDQPTQFEITDNLGSTVSYSGTVGISPTAIPAVAGSLIAAVQITCPKQSPLTKILYASFDGQVSWHPILVGETISCDIRGSKRQIHLKGSISGVEFNLLLEVEGPDV